MNLSFQLYSAREYPPWATLFETLSELGYQHVEGFGALYGEPVLASAATLSSELAAQGLTMPSTHLALDLLESRPAEAVALARSLGVESIVGPFLMPDERPADAAGWRAFAGRLAAIGKRLDADGIGFAWHNHDFELQACSDGTVPLAVILEDATDIGWEADLAWVVRGDADPERWLAEYGERVVAVHLKDIAPAGECQDEDGWADVGHGTMDWQVLIDILRSSDQPRQWIVEHDKPSDVVRFARRSRAAFDRFTGSTRSG